MAQPELVACQQAQLCLVPREIKQGQFTFVQPHVPPAARHERSGRSSSTSETRSDLDRVDASSKDASSKDETRSDLNRVSASSTGETSQFCLCLDDWLGANRVVGGQALLQRPSASNSSLPVSTSTYLLQE